MGQRSKSVEIYQPYKADLRVFGAIGFQDANNGLWLGVQGYAPQESLLDRIVDASIKSKTDVIGLTSMDDVMYEGSPEDRFGFFKKLFLGNPGKGYSMDEIEQGLIIVERDNNGDTRDPGIVYIVNAETLYHHNWKGLQLHVVGGNFVKERSEIEDSAREAIDNGHMVFLRGISYANLSVADRVIEECTGAITHDANNVVPGIFTKIPKIGSLLAGASRSRNVEAQRYLDSLSVEAPGIAVSSAHWMDEIGRAAIKFHIPLGSDVTMSRLIDSVENCEFENICGYNNPFRVLKTKRLLGEHEGNQDRFKGDPLSSYNDAIIVD
jgi:hypothetical protein